MKKKIVRFKENEFCEVDIEFEKGRLSICGSCGVCVPENDAKKQAFDYWLSFFEEMPEEFGTMVARFQGQGIDSFEKGAQFVLDTDGCYHGLDVDESIDCGLDKVAIIQGGGQCVDAIRDYFPELTEALKYHLNDMHAGCEHQDVLEWGNGKDIALDRDSATAIQLEVLQAEIDQAAHNNAVKRLEKLRDSNINTDEGRGFLKAVLCRKLVMADIEDFKKGALDSEIVAFCNASERFKSAIFKGSIGAPCPVCGYRYGTAWTKREVPAEVIAQLEALTA